MAPTGRRPQSKIPQLATYVMPHTLCLEPSALCLSSVFHATRNSQTVTETHNTPYTLCPPPYALYPFLPATRSIRYAVCPAPYALCPMLSALCPMPSSLQFLHQFRHIHWYWRLEDHPLTRMRMGQTKSLGMQHLSGYRFERG